MRCRRLGIWISVVFVFLLFSCTSDTKSPSQKSKVLSLGYLVEFDELDPTQETDTGASTVVSLLFNGLVKIGAHLEPAPDLAASWDVSPDGLVWTFHLRRGVRFHDGVELTSRDVKFTYERIRDPAMKSPWAPLFRYVRKFETPDKYTFRANLTRPYAPVLFAFRRPVIPAHLFGSSGADSVFNQHPVGTGPFQFERWEDSEVVLSAHSGYFGGRPRIDTVRTRLYPDRSNLWSALMRREVDFVERLLPEDYEVMKHNSSFQIRVRPGVFYYMVLFNLSDSIFKDRRAREAVSTGLDRQEIIDLALSGVGKVATGPFLPGSWAYNPQVRPVPYDPDQALALLEDVGWKDTDGDGVLDRKGRPFELSVVMCAGDEESSTAVQAIRQQLDRIGIRVRVREYPFDVLLKDYLRPGRFQATLFRLNAGLDPDFASMFWDSANIGTYNLSRYSSSQVDSLFERGRVTSDLEQRKLLYRQIHSLIAADTPAAFLFFSQNIIALSSRLLGVPEWPSDVLASIVQWDLVPRTGR